MKTLHDAIESIGLTTGGVLGKLRVGIVIADSSNGLIKFANDEFLRMVDYPPHAFDDGDISFLELIHPDDRTASLHLERRIVSGEIDCYSHERRFIRKDGSIIWVKSSVDVIQREGTSVLSVAVTTDVSKSRRFEGGDATEIAAKVATLNFNLKTNTVTISSAYNALHGLPDDHPAPRMEECMAQIHADDIGHCQRILLDEWTDRVTRTAEYRIIRIDGQLRWVRTTMLPFFDTNGDLESLIGATIDITDSRTALPIQGNLPALRNILQFIEEHWDQPISLAQLGKTYGVSARSIYNSFAANGLTPKKFIKTIRLKKARQMLLRADRSATVTAIALRCGFSNLGHFAKDYRSEFGESPSETMRIGKSI